MSLERSKNTLIQKRYLNRGWNAIHYNV